MAIKTFRVEGMREDNRSQSEREKLELAETQPVDMSVDRVLADARARAGLSDFGPMDFTERMGLLLAEVETDENVWQAYKQVFVDRCVNASVNRLLLQRYWSNHPESLEIAIDRPINVVALPRSGSTHLENLLAADRRLRHLPVYMAAQPAPFPTEETVTGPDPRWTRSDERWQQMRQNEILAALHEHSPDHACGENELQIPDFASYQWEWLADVPGFRDYYLAHDQTPHYRFMRAALQAVACQLPSENRWMLKSNQHSEQLGPLLDVYPDAIFVMIHRDPVATLQSLLTMRALGLKASQKVPDIDAHVAYWIERIERMLQSYMRDRQLVPEVQLVEVMFADIVTDDLQVARWVFEQAGLEVTDACLTDMTKYMANHPRGKDGRVVYDLEGDFGLNPDALRERFSFYIDEFDIEPELRTAAS